MTVIAQPLTLEKFLELPETKPASEFMNGVIIQKPMSQGEHSRLQGKLCETINQIVESSQIAYAFPELWCTFRGRSLVPDVAVFRWERIPRQPSGRVANRFELHPDWSIEILSPEQSQTKVLGNLLHCAQAGTELGWLIDPEEETVVTMGADQRVQLLTGNAHLPVLDGIALAITAADLFSWLTL
jgi:Uma2 family endonuclease